MVQLAHIFKKDKDKEKQTLSQEKVDRKEKERKDEPDSPASSPRTSYSTARKSPSKPSPSKSPTKNRFSHSRSSSSTSIPTAPFRFGKSSKEKESHPLNLPPDELRRRLSAMAASRDDQRSSMDIDPQEAQLKNGVNGTEERSPTPPPHRSNSSSTDEADNFKLAGNKFFKDGDYRRAIEEYNKGKPPGVRANSERP
jgi:DnaJ family protein C protein 7